MIEEEIAKVLSQYPVGTLKEVKVAPGGLTNDNWFVLTDQGRYFLRRRNIAYSRESVDFELDLVDHLAALGFPTAPLVRTLDGKLWVEADGRLWELYGYVSGERFNPKNLAQVRSAARLLSRFHKAVARHRIDSCAAPDRRFSLDEISGLLDRFERELRAKGPIGFLLAGPLVGFFRGQAEIILKGLQPLKSQPLVLIHGDFQPTNVLFKGDEAAYLLDFGDAALFYRAYDVAKAVLRFSALRPGYVGQPDVCPRLDLARFKAFMEAYQEEMPLNDDEIRALPALLRGIYLYDTAFFLGKESDPRKQAYTLLQALRFVRWLDRHAQDIAELAFESRKVYQQTP